MQPGVIQSALNAELAPHGLFFAPDPSTKDRCTIGGMIGNNSCGAHSAAYGKTVDNLESMDVLLYDGTHLSVGPTLEADLKYVAARGGSRGALYSKLRDLRDRYATDVRDGFPRLPRRVSGYNLDQLLPENEFHVARAMVGSEGTLGLTLSGDGARGAEAEQTWRWWCSGSTMFFAPPTRCGGCCRIAPQALEGFDDKLPGVRAPQGSRVGQPASQGTGVSDCRVGRRH